MVKCPLCKEQMKSIEPEEYNGFADAYFCDSCQIEQAVHWNSGERIISSRE